MILYIMKKITQKIIAGIATITLVVAGMPFTANAASISNAKDIMSTQKISAAATHDISFIFPSAMVATNTITITFPAAFGGTAATSSTDWTASGKVVTYTAPGVISAGQARAVTVTGLTNPATPGNYSITLTSTTTDTGTFTVPILTDNQVQVTAQVTQGLTFAVSDNAVSFGDLTTANARYATTGGGAAVEPANAHTITAGTNSSLGYTIAVQADTLVSTGNPANTITRILDAAAVTAGTEQFGLNVDYASGGTTPTIEAPFDTYGMTDAAGTPETLVTQTVPTANNILDVNYVANIATLTEAGSYATTFTYTMAANF